MAATRAAAGRRRGDAVRASAGTGVVSRRGHSFTLQHLHVSGSPASCVHAEVPSQAEPFLGSHSAGDTAATLQDSDVATVCVMEVNVALGQACPGGLVGLFLSPVAV